MLVVDLDNSEISKLSKLAKDALANFNQSTQLSGLDTAVCLHREALCLCHNQHPECIVSVGSLAAALYAWFHCTDDILNIDEAISLLSEVVAAYPEAYMYLTDYLSSLSIFLATRFDMNCKREDLQESMTRHRHVLQLTVGINLLLKLGNNFSERFSQLGQIWWVVNPSCHLVQHLQPWRASPNHWRCYLTTGCYEMSKNK